MEQQKRQQKQKCQYTVPHNNNDNNGQHNQSLKKTLTHLDSAERFEPSCARPRKFRRPQLRQARQELHMAGESLGDEDVARGTQNQGAPSFACFFATRRRTNGRRGPGAGGSAAVGAEGSLRKRLGGGGGGHGHDHVRAKYLVGRGRKGGNTDDVWCSPCAGLGLPTSLPCRHLRNLECVYIVNQREED